MKRYFEAIVECGKGSERCLEVNFCKIEDYPTSYIAVIGERKLRVIVEGNKKSSEKSAINAVSKRLNFYESLKRNFNIIEVKEIEV